MSFNIRNKDDDDDDDDSLFYPYEITLE